MLITRNLKMADVIHMDYTLLSTINRFGISLGYGEKTVEEICQKHGVNVDFFLEVINSFHDKNYFPEKKFRAFSLKYIIDYLKNAHKSYLEYKVPKIERLIDKLVEISDLKKQTFLLLKNFFQEYVNELKIHIKREEEEVYPYIINLEKSFLDKKIPKKLQEKLQVYSIGKYEKEHDNIEEKLFDLKNILIKYVPMQKNNNLCNNILSELFKLEEDIKEHSEMEERVMIPQVKAMEKALKTGKFDVEEI